MKWGSIKNFALKHIITLEMYYKAKIWQDDASNLSIELKTQYPGFSSFTGQGYRWRCQNFFFDGSSSPYLKTMKHEKMIVLM